MYTHGSYTSSSWSFQYSVGDDASHPVMEVLVDDGEDRLISSWIEGQGKTSNVVVANTNALWSGSEPQRLLAPGATGIHFDLRKEGVYLFHDEINLNGPVHRLGLVADDEGAELSGMSNMLDQGFLFGVGSMDDDTILCTVSPTGSLSLTTLAVLSGSSTEVGAPGLLETFLDYLPGDSRETKLRILGFGVGLLGLFLLSIAVVVRRSRNKVEELLEEMGETGDDSEAVEVMITLEEDEGPLLSVEDNDEELTVQAPVAVIDEEEEESLAEELERKLEEGEGNARLERRIKRKQMREMAEVLQQGLPPLPNVPMPDEQPPLAGALPPLDGALPLPVPGMPLPDLKRDVVCPSCDAKFSVKDLMLKRTTCPVCGAAFDL